MSSHFQKAQQVFNFNFNRALCVVWYYIMDDKVKISFDGDYKLRILEDSKFKQAEDLEKECSTFVEKISNFNGKVSSLVEVLEQHASRIDKQKLRAIGLRMASENEVEQRDRKKRAMQALIAEKRAELDRYSAQLQSLEQIESEQKAVLERISSVQS